MRLAIYLVFLKLLANYSSDPDLASLSAVVNLFVFAETTAKSLVL
jgi:hypothetical protein